MYIDGDIWNADAGQPLRAKLIHSSLRNERSRIKLELMYHDLEDSWSIPFQEIKVIGFKSISKNV
jgi:hypothetical protein